MIPSYLQFMNIGIIHDTILFTIHEFTIQAMKGKPEHLHKLILLTAQTIHGQN